MAMGAITAVLGWLGKIPAMYTFVSALGAMAFTTYLVERWPDWLARYGRRLLSRPVYQLLFDRPLGPPIWAINKGNPQFDVIDASAAGLKNAVRISSPENFSIDHFCQPVTNAKTAEYIGWFTQASWIYLRMHVTDRNNQLHEAWFTIKRGIRAPHKDNPNSREWCIYADNPVDVADGWTILRIEIEEHFAQTLGYDGYKFHSVSGIRISGPCTIASWAIYR